MPKISLGWIYIIIFGLGCTCRINFAKSDPKILTPKSQTPASQSMKHESLRSDPKLSPAKFRDPIEPSSFESTSFSALVGTPLIREDLYEKRFAALGNFYLFSFPLLKLEKNLFLHFETGPSFSFAKLEFQNPPLKYAHIYLLVPAHLRLIYSLTRTFHFETFAGVMLRPIEYDSRSTTDGGTHSVKDSRFLSPEGGIGFDYNFSPPLKVRFLVGYLFLSGGMELTW